VGARDAAESIWPLHPSNVGTGLPLDGVRVLDLSRVLAGPLCAMVAGDLGADVIKVEPPGGDPVRRYAPPSFGEDATYFLAVNRHRRNVVADLRDPVDRERLERLIEVADAVVDNFLPSQSASLGISELKAAHRDVVWVTVSAAASGGPLADLPSFDLLAQARSGLMGVTGEPDGDPMKVGAPIADVVTGLYGAIALLAGLFARGTGRAGRHFEAPLLESAISSLVNQAQGFLATGQASRRLGNDHPSIAPYGPVRASDGIILLAVATESQFARLVEMLGDEELTTDRYATNDDRVRHREELQRALDKHFSRGTSEQWLDRLGAAGVPAAPVLDVPGALAQAQVAGGDLIVECDSPGGPLRVVSTPLRVDGTRPPVRRGPRSLGADQGELWARPGDGS
jgi:crotonobetainyl-CoA:carnitine CoA-transferase CaiB-like acyl-CoA transferase